VSLKKDARFSVLDDNGFVKIAPYSENLSQQSSSQLPSGEIKKYMFSIENLAWNGYTSNLIPEEIGNGDPISGRKGRIMWFPPYDLSFTDSTSVNWEKTDFIGRGEPIYTYNNTTRTGSLQFKIIIDHPSYVNSLKGESDDLINSLFTGGFEVDKRVINRLTADELAKVDLENNQAIDKVNDTEEAFPGPITYYFPYNFTEFTNDFSASGSFESGIGINADINPSGFGFGLGLYTDMSGITRVDSTNYGLNKSNTITQIFSMKEILKSCLGCNIKIKYYGAIGEDNTARKIRAENVEKWIKDNWISPTDPLKDKRIKPLVDGLTVDPTFIGPPSPITDTKSVKENIKVDITFGWDAKLKEEANPTKKIPNPLGNTNVTKQLTNGIKSRFYTEEGYFRKLEQEDKFVYDSISEKIGFFHPAFHSITPEGFNSRLTFLQQCTRQGPTVYQNGESGPTFDLNSPSDAVTPDNLAFGSPPVCILRLGDFYNTKIILDSVNFGFDPLVWDLNPEGIGVQPMICTVDLNFAFIGGSSLQGPLSKLQNAVTYNFFANTQTYSPQSNYPFDSTTIVEKDGNTTSVTKTGIGGGIYPTTTVTNTTQSSDKEGIDINNTIQPETNQQAIADATNGPTQPPVSGSTTLNDFDRLTITKAFWDYTVLNFNIGRKDGTDNTSLSSNYTLKIFVNGIWINYKPQTLNAANLNESYTLTVLDMLDNAMKSSDFPDKSTQLTVELVGTDYKLKKNIEAPVIT
jgi:hypothetical protein